MKKTFRITAILYFLILCFILPAPAQNRHQQLKDSLRRVIAQSEGKAKLKAYSRLYELYMPDVNNQEAMDTLKTLFDQTEAEAIKQGNISAQGMVYGNLIIALVNGGKYDEAISKIPDCLDFYKKNKMWRFYYQIHMQLITLYNLKGDYEKASEEAQNMYNQAKEQNDKAGMATALYTTSTIYNIQERWKEQEQCLRESIAMLWEVSGYDNILTQAYAFLCMSLRAQGRYDDALKLVPEYEKAINRFEKAIGRTDIAARVNFNTALMNNYIDTRQYDKAEIYLTQLEKIANNSIHNFETLRAKALILQSRGRYNEALACIDSAMAKVSESEFDINLAREIKMEILVRAGRVNEALDIYRKIVATNKELSDTEVNARFDELRTQYEVAKHISEKKRNFHYFLFALGACLILTVLLACVFYYNRVITNKNRNLYKQIKEQDRLTDELSWAMQNGTLSYTGEQFDLVTQLRDYLLTGDNITNVDINRDDIITALGTNKNTLSEAVKAVTGKSPMEYIRTMKIEEARRLLGNHPELTIESVAYSCGFNIPSTFYRLFKKEYGISPSAYRKMAKEQE